jgi:putative hemolysin
VSALSAIEVASIVLVIAWNAFFVAAEYAFVSVRRTKLEELAEAGDRRAAKVRAIVADPSHFIAAMQLGITLSSLALGAIGEPTVARLLQDLFGGSASSWAPLVSVILAFVLITIPHVVLGEIVPKSYTLPRAESVALRVARPVRVFFTLFGPFISFLDWLSQRVMAMLGIPTTDALESAHTEAELRMLVRRSQGLGVLEAEEQQMIDRVFDFADTQAEDVMVPRPDIVALPAALTPAEAMARVLEHPYTRYPVFGDELDDIVGILHVRTLFAAQHNGGAGAGDLRALLRPAYVVPETKRLGPLLAEIRRTKSHMTIVVDEYGSVAGLLTLEDMLEEIVGEIDDEFDVSDVSVVRLGRDRVRVDGSFPIDEFNERFGRDLPEEDYHTLGGFVFGELGRAAEPGDAVTCHDARFVVAEVDGPRIVQVDVSFLSPSQPHPREPDGEAHGPGEA